MSQGTVIGIDPGAGRSDPTGMIGILVDDHQRPPGERDPYAIPPVYKQPTESVKAAFARAQARRKGIAVLPDPLPIPPPVPRRTYTVCFCHRRPQKEEAPELVQFVSQLVTRPEVMADGQAPWVMVDSTGIGIPICADLRRAGVLRMRGILITQGLGITDTGIEWHVGVSRLLRITEVAWRAGDIHIPDEGTMPEIRMLKDEMRTIFPDESSSVTEKFTVGGTDSSGQHHHGDLWTALQLAVFMGQRMKLAPRWGPADFPKITT